MSPWEELGIEPTGEDGLIRKAYAARLKRTRPEDDPAGFGRLRAAYEAALALARQIAAQAPMRSEHRAESPIAVPAPPPEPLLPPEGEAAMREVVNALNGRKTEEAARLLEAASIANLLSLRAEFGLKHRLAMTLLADQAVTTERLIEIATQFGWYDPRGTSNYRPDSIEGRLCARIEAELAAEAVEAADEAEWAATVAKATRPRPWRRWRTIAAYLAVSIGVIALGELGQNVSDPHTPPSGQSRLASAPVSACALSDTAYVDPPRPQDSSTTLDGPLKSLAQEAEAGSAHAQNVLGSAYYKGKGVPQNFVLALSWYRRAALSGDLTGRDNLAAMCWRGEGMPKDAAGARRLFLENTRSNDAMAETWLASMLASGAGGPADPAAGFAWAKRAALQSDVWAMAELGEFYAVGTGTAVDLVKSAAWRHAAAMAGNFSAMSAYGKMALHGEGMKVDLAEAYRWLSLAARNAPDDATRTAENTALEQPSFAKLSLDARNIIDLTVQVWHPTAPVLPTIDPP